MSGTTDLTRGLYRRVYAGYITGRRICSVSLEAEAWFWRIQAVVDDFGNTLADPALLRNATAGRRADVSVQDVERWVAELVSASLVSLYEAGGEQFLHLNEFTERQPAGRNGKRVQKHPLPPSPVESKTPDSPEDDFQAEPGESGGIPVSPGVPSAPHTHKHSHSHTHTQEGAEVGSKNGEEGAKAAAREAEARTQAANWITAECPSFLRSGVAPFTRLILRLGRDEAVRQVQEAQADANVGNPFSYLEAKLDNQHARRNGKAPTNRPRSAVAVHKDE